MMATYELLSNKHAATCFLNALFREWHDYHLYQSSKNLIVEIPLSDERSIEIPLKRYSLFGRHDYSGKFYLKYNEKIDEIDFDQLLEEIRQKIMNSYNMTSDEYDRFKQDVQSSRDTVFLSLQHRENVRNTSNDFISTEQALIIGHALHPTPKSRNGWTSSELKQFSPEFEATFPLVWLLVDNEIINHSFAQSFRHQEWLSEIFHQEYGDEVIPANHTPMPMHPWQWQTLLKNPLIKAYLQERKIIVSPQSVMNWSATSSLRTLYRVDCEYMLKFSMNLKLTNSVRVLLNSEVARGLVLHDVLKTEKGEQFTSEFPAFVVMTEPASVCLVDREGHPIEETIVVCRENVFTKQNSDNKYMLATLLQDDPHGKQNLLLTLIHNENDNEVSCANVKKWFMDYLYTVIKPLIIAYAKYGIIMEGHQQNIVIEVEKGFPKTAYFRDCQDHAYSQLGYKLYSSQVVELRDNPKCLADERIGCHYFIYQVFLNSTFNVIATLAKSDLVTEMELYADLRVFLTDLRIKESINAEFMNILLNDATLLHKGNFKFATTQINDNQVPFDPLMLYTPIPNLIAASRYSHVDEVSPQVLYQRHFPLINKTITLRRCRGASDMQRFIEWQQTSHVACYWQLDQSKAAAAAYLNEVMTNDHQLPVIIDINHEPAGYAEIYWVAHDAIGQHFKHHINDRGFHLLVGEEKFLGINNTKAVFNAIMHFIYLDHADTHRIVVEPDAKNHRFIKYMDIIPGWQFLKKAELSEKNAAIYIHERQYFSKAGVV